MVVVVLVRTGKKYDDWYENNIIHMIHHNLTYDDICVIREGEGNVFDKLKMFKICTDDVNYLYFDLDIILSLIHI